jgi:hypothetical protein
VNVFVDSSMESEEILAQNPLDICPAEILNTIRVMEVDYIGFEGEHRIGQIAVSETAVADVAAFFLKARQMRFPIAKVIPPAHPRYRWEDSLLMAGNISSGFNYRNITGKDGLSLHSLGLAFDINPKQNPYIKYVGGSKDVFPKGAVWEPETPGTLYATHPLVHLMEECGWEWGGHWTPESGRTDYHHFQKAPAKR